MRKAALLAPPLMLLLVSGCGDAPGASGRYYSSNNYAPEDGGHVHGDGGNPGVTNAGASNQGTSNSGNTTRTGDSTADQDTGGMGGGMGGNQGGNQGGGGMGGGMGG